MLKPGLEPYRTPKDAAARRKHFAVNVKIVIVPRRNLEGRFRACAVHIEIPQLILWRDPADLPAVKR